MTDQPPENRRAYRTLSDPSRVLGIALNIWIWAAIAAGIAYAVLMLSPLPWRANTSIVVIGLGAPLALLSLHEASALTPGRILRAAVRWRARPTALATTTAVTHGHLRLTTAPAAYEPDVVADELPWTHAPGEPA